MLPQARQTPPPAAHAPFMTIVSDVNAPGLRHLTGWLWNFPPDARIKVSFREVLGTYGIRRGWQLTWFTESLLREEVPTLGDEGVGAVKNALEVLRTRMGARLIFLPTQAKLQNRLDPILRKHTNGDQSRFEEFTREALPLVLELEWVAR